MNPAQSRLLGFVLIALAVVGWSWSFDQRERSQALRESLTQLISQRDMLLREGATPLPVVRQQLAEQAADIDSLRNAAAGFGSDARNLAAALGRVTTLCSAAGLVECQARRALVSGTSIPRSTTGGDSSTAASRPQPEKRLTPYTVTMLATFNPNGLGDFLNRLQSLDFLHRVDRLVILQNRLELDVVFLHSDELRPDAQPSAGHSVPRRLAVAR